MVMGPLGQSGSVVVVGSRRGTVDAVVLPRQGCGSLTHGPGPPKYGVFSQSGSVVVEAGGSYMGSGGSDRFASAQPIPPATRATATHRHTPRFNH